MSSEEDNNELGTKFFQWMRMIRRFVEAVVVSGVYLKEAKIFEWGMRKIRLMWHDKQGSCLFYLLALGGHRT